MRWRCAAGVAVAMTALFPFAGGEGAGLNGQAVHQCSYCHDVHGGFTSADVALNRDAVVEDMCMTCHGDGGLGYLLGPDLVNDTVNSSIDFISGVHNGDLHLSLPKPPNSCWDCHGHEGDAQGNLFLIPRNFSVGDSVVKTVVFTADTAQADFTGTDGICYVCHEQPTTQANGLSGHYSGVCTDCHAHEGGFRPTGGGACTSCHNVAKGNHREVVSEFDRASHHVQLGGAGADIPPEDCTTCHDQDSAGGHYREGSDLVYLIDPDDSSIIAYDRGVTDPSVLTNFCIGCHDANGATRLATDTLPTTPTAPFSDGNIRPIIDETAWLASSHEGSGDADCADCHEGHGSQKVRLLTPGDSIPDPTTKAEEEEGFCLGCHDSDGPSTIDLKTARDKPVNWVQEATGLNANPYLNDRHDIEWAVQDSSAAKIECVNCHNPHTATSAQPWITDPDPSDGHVPGTDWYFTQYQSAGDVRSEFCLDCHDGTVSNGVVEGHGGLLTNILTTWGGDGMGGRTGSSVDMRPGTGWSPGVMLACADCHKAHIEVDTSPTSAGITTLFRLGDYTYDPTGTTQLAWADRKGTSSFDYSVIDNVSGADETSGGWWCNTCHNRFAMTGKSNCYSCHRHGDGGRF